MAVTKSKKDTTAEVSVHDRLYALYSLQHVDAAIDKIRTIRGELPLEVEDLEAEIEGLQTRVNNMTEELKTLEQFIADKKIVMKDAAALIKKYEEQQMNVRNNREYDSLTKEIEFQNLEIQLAEKKIKESKFGMESKKELIEASQKILDERKSDLEHKKGELNDIVKETQKDEEELAKKSKVAEKIIEDRLLNAYKRIRLNARNGLAVVRVERDSCGGCFNKIPPQRQMDIKTHKKIIVCEHCGRILVDDSIADKVSGSN